MPVTSKRDLSWHSNIPAVRKLMGCDLMDILDQRIRDYCIVSISSRWFVTGANVCGAGGRYPSVECGLTVL